MSAERLAPGPACLTPVVLLSLLLPLCLPLLLPHLLQGVAGNRPPPSQLLSAVQQHELFLYFGHGAGEQYLPRCPWQGLERCAASLLMGCSSGRLRPAGAYEAHGPVWDYLMAGEGWDES